MWRLEVHQGKRGKWSSSCFKVRLCCCHFESVVLDSPIFHVFTCNTTELGNRSISTTDLSKNIFKNFNRKELMKNNTGYKPKGRAIYANREIHMPHVY